MFNTLRNRWSWLDEEPEIRVHVQTPPNWPDVGVLSCTCKFVLVYLYLCFVLFGLQNTEPSLVSPVKPMKAFTHGFTDSVDPDNVSNHPFFVDGEL